MTTQQSDRIELDGEELSLFSNPLESLPEVPRFPPLHTGNWRGHVAKWAIEDGSLYLIDMSPESASQALRRRLPDGGERIPASWFSGILRIPKGRMLEYVHAGYGSKFERYLLVTIEKGRVVESTEDVTDRSAYEANLATGLTTVAEQHPELLGEMNVLEAGMLLTPLSRGEVISVAIGGLCAAVMLISALAGHGSLAIGFAICGGICFCVSSALERMKAARFYRRNKHSLVRAAHRAGKTKPDLLTIIGSPVKGFVRFPDDPVYRQLSFSNLAKALRRDSESG